MKLLLSTALALSYWFASPSSTELSSPTATPPVYTECEGQSATVETANKCFFGQIMSHLQSELKWPEGLNQASDKVYVELTFDTEGAVSDIKVLRSGTESATEEAVRALKTLPNASHPAMEGGKPVKYTCVVPVLFKK
ncbi:MAG: Gram-negative bacterial TonB protein C-terminal [Bacteroidota bacterium]|jgi:outer membrane biosynthesis protein TonB